jgi:SagB-type dehydrogenase family enzyme
MAVPVLLFLLGLGEAAVKLLPVKFTNRSIESCIEIRRSIRRFKSDRLTDQEISNILWAGQGITDTTQGLRAAPSAGATYPLEVFGATPDGLFRYIPQGHAITFEIRRDLRKDIAKAALNQMFIADAGLVIVIAAVFDRTTGHYGERGKRYVMNEVGHCAQNIHLEAVALGLGSVPIGAFDDDRLKEVLGLDDEIPLYVIPVGHPE